MKKVQAVYAGLKTYTDTGTLQSDGTGFMSANSSFQTHFKRNTGFLFIAKEVQNGHVSAIFTLRSKGDKNLVIGGDREAMMEPEGWLIAGFLFPHSPHHGAWTPVGIRESHLDGKAVTSVDFVSNLDKEKKRTLRVDSATYLIVREKEADGKVIVNISPQANPVVTDNDFRQSQVEKGR